MINNGSLPLNMLEIRAAEISCRQRFMLADDKQGSMVVIISLDGNEYRSTTTTLWQPGCVKNPPFIDDLHIKTGDFYSATRGPRLQ